MEQTQPNEQQCVTFFSKDFDDFDDLENGNVTQKNVRRESFPPGA
jgi:hypothetical protein